MNVTKFSSIPPHSVIHRSDRPSYRALPPSVFNLSTLQGNWRSKNEAIWNQSVKQPPELIVARLTGAIVFHKGAVAYNGDPLEGTVVPYEPLQIPTTAEQFVTQPTFLLRGPGDANFGHWLAELAPRVFDLRRAVGNLPIKYAVAANPIALRPMRQKCLEYLGIPETDIYWLDTTPTRFSELFVMGPNSIHSHVHDSRSIREFVGTLKPKLAGDVICEDRLYVRRPKGLKRGLVNEDEVEDFFARRGFVSVSPETYSFEEQVRLFASATMVVGVSGAALTNVMWSRPGCRVLSLSPNVGAEFFFWDLANIFGHAFGVLFGHSNEPEKLNHGAFTVSMAAIEKAYAEFLGFE